MGYHGTGVSEVQLSVGAEIEAFGGQVAAANI